MYINPDKCVACGNCTYVCPMGAIYVDPTIKRAKVNLQECVECYACYTGLSQEHLNPTIVRTTRKIFQMLRLRFDPEPDVCPTAAFEPDELTWPRVVRRAFSDPRVPHESTGVEGRGTEEVKTNDISGRVKSGEAGFTIEFGRPGVGVWMREIQLMCWALADAGVAFEKRNPITSLMTDVATGTLREDILNEKLMSAIVEIKVPGRARRGSRAAGVGRRKARRHGRGARRRHALRRERRRQRRRAGARAARLLAAAREDERRPRPRHESGGGASRIGDGKVMTNTLHRFGDAQSFRDDYIVFAIASRGKNDENSVPKLRRFLEIAMQFKPVNLGDSRHGGAYRPSRSMSPLAHWNRDNEPDFQKVIDGFDTTATAAAVFDNLEAAEQCTKAVREADLGLSINISTSVDGAIACCNAAGIPRHSAGYSLGFEGKTEHLPNGDVLALSTMCGHGMVSQSLAKKMIDWVKEGRRTPEQASVVLSRFCSCGVFNPSRATRLLEEARERTK